MISVAGSRLGEDTVEPIIEFAKVTDEMGKRRQVATLTDGQAERRTIGFFARPLKYEWLSDGVFASISSHFNLVGSEQ